MTNSDKQLRDAFSNAFNEVHAPDDLKARTLVAIEAKRAEENRAEGNFEEPEHATLPEENIVAAGRNNPEKAKGPEPKRLELALPRTKKRFRVVSSLRAKIALAACAVLIALGVGGGAYAYTTPTAYVGIDVNPSIELGLNCFDYVVSAEGLNDDGKAVLGETNFTNMRYDDAMRTLDKALANDGYLNTNSAVAVTIACDDERRCTDLEQTSQQCFASAGQGVHCSRTSSDEHHAAHEAGMGMGKYQVWKALTDAGVDISAEEAANMTMAQLRSLAAQEGVELGQTAGQGTGSEEGKDADHNRSEGQNEGASLQNNAHSSAQEGVPSELRGDHRGNGHHND